MSAIDVTRFDPTGTSLCLTGEDVTVHFDGVKAVEAVSLELDTGCLMGLIGPNGAGKSTFLNAVSGFVPLTAGRVKIGNRDLSHLPAPRIARLGIARTFQDSRVFKGLSVLDNVTLGALIADSDRREAISAATEVLKLLGIGGLAHVAAGELALGDERRVGLARAVAMRPAFLLLDEPAAGLDGSESSNLAAAIVSVRDRLGCGVLLVEHDMRVIFGICERLQVLDSGRTIAVGTVDEVRHDPRVIEAYFGVHT